MSIDPNLLEDFSYFRDPATDLREISGKSGSEILITRDGTDRKYFFDNKSGKIERRDGRQKVFSSFKSLLASDDFASLDSLYETQKRLLEPKGIDRFLEVFGNISSSQNSAEIKLNFAEFKKIALPMSSTQTHCLLIDGSAGVGKTSLIERLVLERARLKTMAPVLHVTSKGRRLANIRDALAGTISDLRAKFVPTEIPVLVRHHLLQIAFDGFDEFVDPDGYKDAWAALRDFMRDCGSAGPLLLAGRDTFFDQQKFAEKLSNSGSKVSVTNIRLSEVSPSHAKAWLTQGGWSSEQVESADTDRYLRPGSYILRPFFLSRIREVGSWETLKNSNQSPQTFIISSMMEREASILSQPLEMSKENLITALSGLFESIAEDMADREVDTVPLNYLGFVAEVAFEGLLDPSKFQRLQHSIGSLALLEIAENGGSVRFPHSEIQNRFLVRHLIRSLKDNIQPAFLGRIILGLDRMEAFSERVVEISRTEADEVDVRLNEMKDKDAHNQRSRDNLNALSASMIVRDDTKLREKTFDSIYFNDLRFFRECSSATMLSVQIGRLDIRDGDLSNVHFGDTLVSVLIVNELTKLGSNVPQIGIIQIQENSHTTTLRSVGEKEQWLSKHSSFDDQAESESDRNLPLVKLFDRICRRFQAQTYIRDSDNDPGSYLMRGEYWQEIKDILSKYNRIFFDVKESAGRPDKFYYMSSPATLINPSDEVDLKIRNEVILAGRRIEN